MPLNITYMNEALLAISPVDGRYSRHTQQLQSYFSEYALIQYRLRIEVEYFLALCELPLPQLEKFPNSRINSLRDLYLDFDLTAARRIKEIEKTTNHDVKAVEYYIKEQLPALGLEEYGEFVHFGLTSQDINNTAVPLLLKEFLEKEFIPDLGELIVLLQEMGERWEHIPMLARTHGQPASPTRLGKELMVFVERLDQQLRLLRHIPHSAKFGGATGNFNAHKVTYPDIDWRSFGTTFVGDTLGLQQSWPTTQIEHYDNMAALFDNLKRLNTIILDLDRDMWTYVSMNYFRQKIVEGEVGSSAMPHKVNPIDFENSEGNLGLANALFEHLAAKLPLSRLQRDLTDSTVLRNIGVPLAHSTIALKSTLKGLNKLSLHQPALENDLEKNWAVVAEAIQNILRREGFKKPYETLKNLTRQHEVIDQTAIHAFIDTLEVTEAVKEELRQITPQNYTGL